MKKKKFNLISAIAENQYHKVMFGIYRKSMYFYCFIDVVKTKNCYQMTVIFLKLNVKIGFKDSTV